MTHRLEGSLWLGEGGQQATQRTDNNGDLLPPRLPPPRTPTITDSPNTGIMRRMLYRNNIHIRKLSKFLALLHDDLHWLDVPQRVQYKLCATVHRCLQHKITTVHDGLLHPQLRHCSSPASAVRRLPSAVRTATPAFNVRSSGFLCGRPSGLELVTRLPARSVTFL